jgi:dTDP-L-rhamnose 4-epimerase
MGKNMKSVLITGGGGFIGTNLSNYLIDHGYEVTIIDNYSKQIHGTDYRESDLYKQLNKAVNVIVEDVQSENIYKNLFSKIDTIVHFAAETGTGQSMYEVKKYTDTNISGSSIILDAIAKKLFKNLNKMIIASSRAVYGEGAYLCDTHDRVFPDSRLDIDLEAGDFSAKCPFCNSAVSVVPTRESDRIAAGSVYGLTKYTQEQLFLLVGKAANIPTTALRYQNVYGPGQSLSNPYTGILSIFSTRIKNNNHINIFEDGLESRDFVYIDDIVQATYLAMINDDNSFHILNVGSGVPTSVLTVAQLLLKLYESQVSYSISGAYRIGDIRHNIADLVKVKAILGFQPLTDFNTGLGKFTNWVDTQEIKSDDFEKSIDELKKAGLYKQK